MTPFRANGQWPLRKRPPAHSSGRVVRGWLPYRSFSSRPAPWNRDCCFMDLNINCMNKGLQALEAQLPTQNGIPFCPLSDLQLHSTISCVHLQPLPTIFLPAAAALKMMRHCEPVRTPAWQSRGSFRSPGAGRKNQSPTSSIIPKISRLSLMILCPPSMDSSSKVSQPSLVSSS